MVSIDQEAIKRSMDVALAKLGRRARLQRSIDTPVKQRTALDAAHCALARHIENGTFR